MNSFLKQILLIATAALSLYNDDRVAFRQKLSDRLRLSSVPGNEMIAKAISPKRIPRDEGVLRLAAVGEYSKAIDILNLNAHDPHQRDVHRALRLAEELNRLKTPLPDKKRDRLVRCGIRPFFLLTNSLPHTYSGYTIRGHETLKALNRRHIEAAAMTRLGYPALIGRMAKSDIEVIEGIAYFRALPAQYPGLLAARDRLTVDFLVDAVRKTQSTILHTTTDYKNGVVVAEAARILGIPWVYEVRGELHKTWLSKQPVERQSAAKNSEFYNLAQAKELECMAKSDAVVVLSEISKQQFIAHGIDENKIHVIPNAVDEAFVGKKYSKWKLRDELGLPMNQFLVGTVTSVVDYEGIDLLLQALLKNQHFSVVVVGDGESRPRLEALSRKLEVENRVLFTGKQANSTIWKWYASLDVFAMPRKDEEVTRTVTPIKGLMAQALGVPVISSDLPALREITGGHETYFQAGCVEDLADAIEKVRQNPEPQVGALEWASNHTWASNAERYENLYKALATP